MSQNTVSTTKTSPLMPQRKMIAVYSENPETIYIPEDGSNVPKHVVSVHM
jgi:hypothetical protein